MANYGLILVATDLSEHSLSALHHADGLAERLGSKVIVCYVVEDRIPPIVLAAGSDIEDLIRQHTERAEETLRDLVSRNLVTANVETIVRRGVPHEVVIALVNERKVDLVVVGMHGHGYLKHALTGSTAERVLHHTPCPVLVVPHA